MRLDTIVCVDNGIKRLRTMMNITREKLFFSVSFYIKV